MYMVVVPQLEIIPILTLLYTLLYIFTIVKRNTLTTKTKKQQQIQITNKPRNVATSLGAEEQPQPQQERQQQEKQQQQHKQQAQAFTQDEYHNFFDNALECKYCKNQRKKKKEKSALFNILCILFCLLRSP